MKVLAINGSPRREGTTYGAIKLVTTELSKHKIDSEIVHIGNGQVRGCIACGICIKSEDKKCAFNDDIVNELIEKSKSADGLIIASPVHFSGVAGAMKCVLDRFFYAGGKDRLAYKVGLSLVTLRRSGGVAAFQQLNNYLSYASMVVVSSHYWNVIHGINKDEILKDYEGVQIMKKAGENMVWLLKKLNRKDNIITPNLEPPVRTNFVR